MRLCEEKGCFRKHYGKGFCCMHYFRYWRKRTEGGQRHTARWTEIKRARGWATRKAAA